jgi:DNA-binding NtrC family response regulator
MLTPPPSDGYRVLIADDEENLRLVLHELLRREGCRVDEAEDGAQAVELARKNGYDLFLLDMKMPKLDGLSALREIRQHSPDALAVMITAYGSQQHALEALRAGAYDYFTKPFNIEELRVVLLRALEKQQLVRSLRLLEQQMGANPAKLGRIIGECAPMREVFNLINRVAEHDVTVLITGESGTGKELVARAIHDGSARSEGPFITVNCAAIPDALLESELFGHERGAFTGAVAARPGRFEAANGGTIFLDEIGELPLALQAKLLRVLQQHEIERIGANTPRQVDVRVLTATNRDLEAMVARREFREDLFFRINVVPVALPPLRNRQEDLPRLVQFFIGEFNARFGKRVEGLTPDAMGLLEQYAWPGNVRELENTIQRAMVMTSQAWITPEVLPPALRLAADREQDLLEHEIAQQNALASRALSSDPDLRRLEAEVEAHAIDLTVPLAQRIESIVEEEERRMILAALSKMNGRRQETADLLGISRKSLHNKMHKYGMFDRDEDGLEN